MGGKRLGELKNSVPPSSSKPLRPPGSLEGVIFACSLNLNQTVRALPLFQKWKRKRTKKGGVKIKKEGKWGKGREGKKGKEKRERNIQNI